VGCPTIVGQPTLYANTGKFHLPHKTLFDNLCTNINPKIKPQNAILTQQIVLSKRYTYKKLLLLFAKINHLKTTLLCS